MTSQLEIHQPDKLPKRDLKIPHEFIEEAYRSTFPYSPLPGVSPERMDISRVGDNAPELSEDLMYTTVELSQRVNRKLAEAAERLKPGRSNKFMTMLYEPPEAEQFISDAVYGVSNVAKRYTKIQIVCPPGDGIPLGRLLKFMDIPEDRIHGIEIKGTTGMETGDAQIMGGPLPRKLVQKGVPTMIFDGLPDSGGTTAALAQAIFMKKYPELYDARAATSLRHRLKIANGNGNKGSDVYLELAQLCAAAELVPVFVVTKNPQFDEAIKYVLYELQEGSPEWQETLHALLNVHESKVVPNVWLEGLFDTGEKLSTLRTFFEGEALWDHPLFRYGIRPKSHPEDPDNEWLNRLAIVPGLLYLDVSMHHEKNMLKLEADTFRQMAKQGY